MNVAIYARLSKEDTTAIDDEQTGTERQIADCVARAEREGWNVVGVYEDADHSASNPRRKRPAFDQMLDDLGDGVQVDAVLCYKLDRLLRQPVELRRPAVGPAHHEQPGKSLANLIAHEAVIVRMVPVQAFGMIGRNLNLVVVRLRGLDDDQRVVRIAERRDM